MPRKLNILIASSEAVPFIKTGGLADVVGALPKELEKLGHNVKIVLPRYYGIDANKWNLQNVGGPLGVNMGSLGELWCGAKTCKLPNTNIDVYFIDYENYFGRKGPYSGSDGEGYGDNYARFAFFSKACLDLCKMINFRPDVAHVNDWHTSPIATMLNSTHRYDDFFKDTASLLTIHNMQHQGSFYLGDYPYFLGTEYDSNVNMLRDGIYNANIINTVSNGYADEIKTQEYACGLEKAINDRSGDLYGIVNGIDYSIWNPEIDKKICANYNIYDLSGKESCKRDLQRTFGLPERADVPVVAIVSRLAKQKGVDVVAEAIYRLVNYDMQLVILGEGEIWTHFFFPNIAVKHPHKVACHIGYNESLAHKIEAGADFFLMPSRFEPCGLNQLYSLSYGTLPIVRATGGLNDTVDNYDEQTGEGNGFKFGDLTADAIYNTVGWAMYTYYNRKDHLYKLIKNAMGKRFTWQRSALKYEEMYYKAVEKRVGAEQYKIILEG